MSNEWATGRGSPASRAWTLLNLDLFKYEGCVKYLTRLEVDDKRRDQGRIQEFKKGGAKLDRARSARTFFSHPPRNCFAPPPHIGQ